MASPIGGDPAGAVAVFLHGHYSVVSYNRVIFDCSN